MMEDLKLVLCVAYVGGMRSLYRYGLKWGLISWQRCHRLIDGRCFADLVQNLNSFGKFFTIGLNLHYSMTIL